MAKIRAKLRELRNADVRFISLVDRAATRIPFRVLKRDGEHEMDLTKIFKGDQTKPEVASVVVFVQPDATVAEQVRQSIAGAGFMTTTVQKSENGETVSYTQGKGDEDTVLVRLSDQMLVTMKGLTVPEGFVQELVEKHGCLLDLGNVMGAMYQKLSDVRKAEKPHETAAAIVEGFGAYMHTMLSLPESVFKAEAAVKAALASAVKAAPTEEEKEADMTAMEDEDEMKKTKEKCKKDEEKPAAETVEETPEVPPANASVETPANESVVEPSSGARVGEEGAAEEEQVLVTKTEFQQLMDALTGVKTTIEAQVGELTQKVENLASEQASQKKVLDEAVKKSETLESKLSTTIVNSVVPEDRPAPKETVTKQEDNDPRTGAFDTAYIRRRKY